MSLIDEALKRAQAAQGDEKRPEAARRPWTPAPLPDPGRSGGRKTIRAAVLVAVAAPAVFAAFVLLRRAPDKTAAVLPAPTARVRLFEPSSSAQATKDRSTKDGEGKAAVQAAESSPPRASRMAAAAVSPGSSSSVQAAAPATVAPDRATALVDGKTYFGSITLAGGTRIELGGIVSSESNATALVNGKIVGAGAYVEGFTVVRIEEGRMELQGNGLTIFLALR